MKSEPKYNDPGLHLTPFGRRALLIGIIIALAMAIVWTLTDTAGAAPECPPPTPTPPPTAITLSTFSASKPQLSIAVCKKGTVVDFLDAKGGHVVYVVWTGESLMKSYYTTRHFKLTQRVSLCAGIVK